LYAQRVSGERQAKTGKVHVVLSDLLHRAQAALNEGDYALATAACEHVLASYPTCLSAHRMLGQAFLEQGAVDEAIVHFASTLNLDPLDIVARLGFGVAADERNDPTTALFHSRRAWDLDQLRDELVRLLTTLDEDASLHPSRAGLASLHARNGRLDRAATEWRAVLAAEPTDDRASIALAEVLWRKGDDQEATTACHNALKREPRNARALAILAEIEHRRNAPTAHATASRYQMLDPGNDIVGALSGHEPPSGLSFLIHPVEIAEFRYTPAPMPATSREQTAVERSGAEMPNAAGGLAPDLWAPVAPVGTALVPFDWSAVDSSLPDKRKSPAIFDLFDELDDDGAALVGPIATPQTDLGGLADAAIEQPALDGWDDIGRALTGVKPPSASAAAGDDSLSVDEVMASPLPTERRVFADERDIEATAPATDTAGPAGNPVSGGGGETTAFTTGAPENAEPDPWLTNEQAFDSWSSPAANSGGDASFSAAWSPEEVGAGAAPAEEPAAGSLFVRLRVAKADRVAAGDLRIERTLATSAGELVTPGATMQAAPSTAVAPTQAVDLAAVRHRLRQGPDEASAVVRVVEAAMAKGQSTAEMTRVLGEAYLQLGETGKAAAYFRQAMTARRARVMGREDDV